MGKTHGSESDQGLLWGLIAGLIYALPVLAMSPVPPPEPPLQRLPEAMLETSQAPAIFIDLEPEPTKEPSVFEIIQSAADHYRVPYEDLEGVIDCETMGTFDPTIRSKAKYTYDWPAKGIKAGEQEQSYGLAQIHLPDWPDVTIEQAKDPVFASEFMARHFASGDHHLWACWDIHRTASTGRSTIHS